MSLGGGIIKTQSDTVKAYKYRGQSTLARDLQSLVECSFFAPTPERLNDLAEVLLNDRLLRQIVGAIDPGVSEHYSQFVEMRHKVGVYALSRAADDELMWAYYGGGHQGICIEYDVNRLLLEAGTLWSRIDVAYSDRPPEMTFEDLVPGSSLPTAIQKLAGHKSRRWQHEEELRIVTTSPGVNYFAQAAVKAIYFGCRCTDEDQLKVRTALFGWNVAYYKLSQDQQSYRLQSDLLEHDPLIDGRADLKLAPMDSSAVPDIDSLGPFSALHPALLKAVEIVRRDPSCIRVTLAEVSRTGPRKGKVFVTFESAVPSVVPRSHNWFFDPSDLR